MEMSHHHLSLFYQTSNDTHYSIQTRKCAAHYLFSYLHRYFPLEIMFAKFKMSTYIEKLSWKCSFLNYFKPNHYHSFPAHGMHSTPTCKKGWYYSNDTFDVQFQPQEKQTNKQPTNQLSPWFHQQYCADLTHCLTKFRPLVPRLYTYSSGNDHLPDPCLLMRDHY